MPTNDNALFQTMMKRQLGQTGVDPSTYGADALAFDPQSWGTSGATIPTEIGPGSGPAADHPRYQQLLSLLPAGGDAHAFLSQMTPSKGWLQTFMQWANTRNRASIHPEIAAALAQIPHAALDVDHGPGGLGHDAPPVGSGGRGGEDPGALGHDAPPVTPTSQWTQFTQQQQQATPTTPTTWTMPDLSGYQAQSPVTIRTPDGSIEQVNSFFVPFLLSRGARLVSGQGY